MAFDEKWAHGIDVSHDNGHVDWPAVKGAGISFVGIKATEGLSLVDPHLHENREGARAQDFDLVIYYHFGRSGDPGKQAEHLKDSVGDLLPNERLCLDLEVAPMGVGNMGAWIDAFYDVVLLGQVGRQLIYTSNRIWRQVGNPVWGRASDVVDLWAPRYNGLGNEPVPPPPWEERGWKIWQWTDGGDTGPDYEVPGVGRCDVDVFHGTPDDLRAWVGEDITNGMCTLAAKQLVSSLTIEQFGHMKKLFSAGRERWEILREAVRTRAEHRR